MIFRAFPLCLVAMSLLCLLSSATLADEIDFHADGVTLTRGYIPGEVRLKDGYAKARIYWKKETKFFNEKGEPLTDVQFEQRRRNGGSLRVVATKSADSYAYTATEIHCVLPKK